MESSFRMLGAYARHAALESLHACNAAKLALVDPLRDVLVISLQQDT